MLILSILFPVVVPLGGGPTVNAKPGAPFRVVDGEGYRWAGFPGKCTVHRREPGVVPQRREDGFAMGRTNGDVIRAVGCPG